jgi:hypothetical protein
MAIFFEPVISMLLRINAKEMEIMANKIINKPQKSFFININLNKSGYKDKLIVR